MAEIRPFNGIRPRTELARRVAALPYDVYSREEARVAASKDPLSFLNIDRPETQFPEDYDMYAPEVYARAAEMFNKNIEDGIYVTDKKACYYIYELTMNNRTQTGIVACAAVDDYLNNVIKKHENTRKEKEIDRINHVYTVSAQTGPIFLAYREDKEIRDVVGKVKQNAPEVSFTSDDNITHRVWVIDNDEYIAKIHERFSCISNIYIADGHHRAASAVNVGLKKREEDKLKGIENKNAEYNFFLSVLFPDSELMIMPYNRVVRDLNGLSETEFLDKLSKKFEVSKSDVPVSPMKKLEFGMYLSDNWYLLKAKNGICDMTDPVKSLDVSVLQENVLDEILGIKDPKTDKRIDFVGGIRGLTELEKRCKKDMKVAFSMYPTSISELFTVADAGLLMPPKSTWFEPKLRSGLFMHKI